MQYIPGTVLRIFYSFHLSLQKSQRLVGVIILISQMRKLSSENTRNTSSQEVYVLQNQCLNTGVFDTFELKGPFNSFPAHILKHLHFSSAQLLSHVWLFATPWTAAYQAFLSFTNSWSLLKLIFIKSVMPSNHLILCCPLLLLPSIFPSSRVFSNESLLCIRWPKYWSFSFSTSPSNEYSGLISFRIDRFDLLAVQGTLKNLLQNHNSKASILQCSAFFVVQLSHPHMTPRKTIALIRWTLVSKVMSLLFNILCRFVIVFLPRSTRLLISWLQSPSAVILEPKKIACQALYYHFVLRGEASTGTGLWTLTPANMNILHLRSFILDSSFTVYIFFLSKLPGLWRDRFQPELYPPKGDF